MRIVSLVPSLTELICDLGLSEQLVGRTRFCVHPADVMKETAIIGGTKNPDPEKIKQLQPDLVIANKEENRKEDVEAIRSFSDVMVTDVSTVDEALKAITDIGRKTNTTGKAESLREEIEAMIPQRDDWEPLRVVYLIWEKPCMSVGGDTYIHDVLGRWGLVNLLGEQTRYPEITADEMRRLAPDFLLLSSEPYPFSDKHIRSYEKELPETVPVLVNGEYFSWYGSRMLKAFAYLNRWRPGLQQLSR